MGVLVIANVKGQHIDFWRDRTDGRFYHLRKLQLCLLKQFEPYRYLDYSIWTRRVTEVVAIASHFGRRRSQHPK